LNISKSVKDNKPKFEILTNMKTCH